MNKGRLMALRDADFDPIFGDGMCGGDTLRPIDEVTTLKVGKHHLQSLVSAMAADPDMKMIEDRLVAKGMERHRAQLCVKAYIEFQIASLENGNDGAPCEMADEAWHAHILHTREYAAFCSKYLGGFRHHNPNVTVEQVSATYMKTKRTVYAIFHNVDVVAWETEAVMCNCGACD